MHNGYLVKSTAFLRATVLLILLLFLPLLFLSVFFEFIRGFDIYYNMEFTAAYYQLVLPISLNIMGRYCENNPGEAVMML